MVRPFGDRNTERLWRREPVRSYDSRILRVALQKPTILDAVVVLDELRVPPGNRLEDLKGNCAGGTQHSDQRSVAHLLHTDAKRT